MLPPLRRLPRVRSLIDAQAYFVLHAPRQSGKSTALGTMARELTREGRYVAILLSMETGAPHKQDVVQAERAILRDWRETVPTYLPPELWPPSWPDGEAGGAIRAALAAWSRASPRPLVVFLDEIDALEDTTLVAILRQLRSGHSARPANFPWSLGLCGMRDVRDYKVKSGGKDRLHSASPFNIKDESLTLRNFTRDEVGELYRQHTEETGQGFLPEAVEHAFHLSAGHPWLVNALARQVVEELVSDRTQSITAAHFDQAKDLLIQRQDTHLDSLGEALQDPRIRQIIEPMLIGGLPSTLPEDDIRYAIDLGLIRHSELGGLIIANPIYREIIPRKLTVSPSAAMPQIQPTWLREDGSLDPERLLQAFLSFWRRHGEPLMKTAPYHEAAPHLVLMSFLDRVANGGGVVEREYASGSGRLDLWLRYGPVTIAIEVKVWAQGEPDPLAEGLEQMDGYCDRLLPEVAWLVIFDRRPAMRRRKKPVPAEPRREPTPRGREVLVIRA